jgi:hypothetical protein
VVLAVEFSFGPLDAALLGAAVVFALFEVWGLERFVSWRASAARARRAELAWAPRLAADAPVDVPAARGREARGDGGTRKPFDALGDMYPLLTARAARVLEERFGYSGPGSAPTLPSAASPERWQAMVATFEPPYAEEDELASAPRPMPDAVEELEAEPPPEEPEPVRIVPGDDRPLVRWGAAAGLVLAVFLLLLIV